MNDSKESGWWQKIKNGVSTGWHSVLGVARPALEDLASKSVPVIEELAINVGKDIVAHKLNGESQGKDFSNKDGINELIGVGVSSAEKHAQTLVVPLLQTTLHTVAANAVAQAIDLKPVDYHKLNN